MKTSKNIFGRFLSITALSVMAPRNNPATFARLTVALLKGGETGPAVVAGKPDESLLLKAVSHTAKLRMPPDDKLTAAR